MLYGMDVSRYQELASDGTFLDSDVEAKYQEAEFVIAKATQGISYVNSYNCDKVIQRAIKDGKKFGFYHYAGGNDPEDEAQWFYDNCLGYIGEGIPCLDFEKTQNNAWSDSDWCLKFVNKFYELTAVWPVVYTSAAYISKIASCSDYCGLWVAGYPDTSVCDWSDKPKFAYSISPWDVYTIWQFTNSAGVLDLDVANLTEDSWDLIARGDMDELQETEATEDEADSGHCSCCCCN